MIYAGIKALAVLSLMSPDPLAQTAPPVIFEIPLSPRIANYAIDVRLDTANRTLQGTEVVTWHNRSADVIAEMQFHLYMNAFRNNKSTLTEESDGTVRGSGIDQDSGWGYIEISRIALPSGQDLTDQMRFVRPDNDNEMDKTVMSLPLPQALPPGDSVTLRIDFSAKLPTPPVRTGIKNEYCFAGQWFPKAGVYIDGAWNCHQFHANSEFFADFGVYDVRITVPKENVIGATGLEVSVTVNDDGTATHYYHAEDVHDFAWAASPEFVEFTGDTQDVAIRILMQPDRVSLASRYLTAAKAAVAYFQEWIGDYPFPNLTVIDPRRGAINSGGMEYPTLFTALGIYGLPEGVRLIQATIIHEFAHGYWQHLVASNEFEESWLDEGLATYSEDKIMNDLYGPQGDVITFMGVRINTRALDRAEYVTYPDRDPVTRCAWKYYSETSFVVNSFYKPAMMLFTLENYLGEDTMREILRAYYARWRFRHPNTQDFVDVVNEVAGTDLNWFFDQILYSNAVLDYSVSWVSSKEVDSGKGYDFTLDPIAEDKTSDSAKVESAGEEKETDSTLYLTRVKVRRLGSFTFPVEVEIRFDHGDSVREVWDGKDTWTEFRYIRPAKLVSATVDPDRKILLDVNLTNNSRTLESKGAGVAKLCMRMLFWAQFMMEQPDMANLLSILEGFPLE